jgi:glycosyltransferase involved in cell wall biosynthesis
MKLWLLVAGDVVPLGGMDSATFALARYLAADPRVELHLVAHRVAPDLVDATRVRSHLAWRPFGSHVLGAPLMARLGQRWAERLAPQGANVIVSGGNCPAGDVTWLHYVHAAYAPVTMADPLTRLKDRWRHVRDLGQERRALRHARLVLCNSRRTQTDVVERINVPASRTRVVYYGIDARRFSPISADERAAERQRLGWAQDRPVAVFIGALSDRRKGFDTLFDAWRTLCRDPAWDGDLAVVGTGAELPAWRARAATARLQDRIHFLGYRHDVDHILAACDVLVHPARYEAYGLGVHEALCRGLPAMVSRSAGVAEQYPSELAALLLEDPDSARELADRLQAWRSHLERLKAQVAPFSAMLRARTWDDMAREIVRLVEAA